MGEGRREIQRTCFMQRLVKIGQMVRNLEEECPIGTSLFRQFADCIERSVVCGNRFTDYVHHLV